MADGESAMSQPVTLRVSVDPERCQGHARCSAIAPELFVLDEYGNAHPRHGGVVPPGLEEKAYLARSNCPEFAIAVAEEGSR